MTGSGLLSGCDNRVVRTTVDGILAPAGVRITWVDGKHATATAGGTAVMVQIRLIRQPVDVLSSSALAYTKPFARGGQTITILPDQLRKTALRENLPLPHILAHVLAHELGHVLQRSCRHADTGLMKAVWDRNDYRAMARNALEFTSTDVELIQDGLSRLGARAGYAAGAGRGR